MLQEITYFAGKALTVKFAIGDLYTNDQVLACKNCDQYSVNPANQRSATNPDSEYELYSDRSARLWPGYKYEGSGIM